MAPETEVRFITAEELLAADDRPEKIVEMPEWGGPVKIKALSLGQLQEISEQATSIVNGKEKQDTDKLAVLTVAMSLLEPKLTPEQSELLKDKSVSAMTRLMQEITEYSGASDKDLKAAEARFPEGAVADV